MKIKVFEKTAGCLPEVSDKGDWIDLYTAETVNLVAPEVDLNKKADGYRKATFDSNIIPLGVCVEVPEGFESIVAPRSSTFRKYGLMESNSIGIIDQSYKSDKDEWKMPVVATKDITIPKGTRLCQFRIQPNQKATMWQKLKWLFSSGIEIEQVDSLDNPERGGFGSTGV